MRRSLFPQISLTASASSSSFELANVLASPAQTTAGIIGEPRADCCSTTASAAATSSRRSSSLESSLANYRRAVLGAFNEVEVALSNIQLLEEQAEVAASSLAAAEEAFRIAEVRYAEGVADFETVLHGAEHVCSRRATRFSTTSYSG